MVTSPFLFLCWLIISDQIEICQGQSKTRVVKEEAPMPIQLSLLGGRRRKSVIFVSYMVRRIFSLKKHWQAGYAFQLEGRPATQDHQYIRGKTCKFLTLFRPATGELRA